MKEKLVTFGTAKLAKEKGLPQESYPCFSDDGEIHSVHYFVKENTKSYFQSTQSIVQQFLREAYNVQVYAYSSTKNLEGKYIDYVYCINGSSSDHRNGYDTYEDALEFGLQKALKLV